MCVESNSLPATTERIWKEAHRESHATALRWTMNAILATLELDKEDLAQKSLRTSPRSKEVLLYWHNRKINARRQVLIRYLKVTERFLEIFAQQVSI